MDDAELWTLEQLSERVAQALAVNYEGQSNGRVREVPNARTIRWYTTIGLVDRPAEMRGRVALYGRRHLLQLVAVKRLQAAGRPLAEVQREIVGSTDDTLARIARLPDSPTSRTRFWASTPAAHPADADSVIPEAEPARVSRMHGIRLNDTVTILLDGMSRAPTAEELNAIQVAAAPLLAVLDRLGRGRGETP